MLENQKREKERKSKGKIIANKAKTALITRKQTAAPNSQVVKLCKIDKMREKEKKSLKGRKKMVTLLEELKI